MAQPKAMRASPRVAVEGGEERRPPRGRAEPGRRASWSRAPGRVARAGDDEGAVVDAALGAEALGQPPAPRPLLARGLVAGAGDDVGQALEGGEAGRRRGSGCRPARPRRGRPARPGGSWSPIERLAAPRRGGASRFTDASPMSTHGVPPMRSRVQKEKPASLAPSWTWVIEHPLLRAAWRGCRRRSRRSRRRRCRPSPRARSRSVRCSPWSRPRVPSIARDLPWTPRF